MRRVVITGIGPFCAGVRGKDDFFRLLLEKKPVLRAVPPEYEKHYKYRTRFFVPYLPPGEKAGGESAGESIGGSAGTQAGADTGMYPGNTGGNGGGSTGENTGLLTAVYQDKGMEDMSKIAVDCAGMALADAGFGPSGTGADAAAGAGAGASASAGAGADAAAGAGADASARAKAADTQGPFAIPAPAAAGTGVILGIGMPSLSTAFTSYTAHAAGQGRFNRLVIPMLMTNAPAAWVAMKYGIAGECHTVNAACASGTVAVGEAYRKVAAGQLDMCLAGGADCLRDSRGAILRGFDSLGALTAAEDGLPRPFSRNRSGFLFNMGAGCVLVLEELERAKARGARIYAEITGYACNTCCDGIVQMPADHRRLLPLFAMARHRIIGYYNAHGTGTLQSDSVERELIRAVWGEAEHQPAISSTKGIIGHSIGASGALEAAVTALSLRNQEIHGNLTDTPMEGLNLPVMPGKQAMEHALSASFGFGGHNALLMFTRYGENL